jgi:hypothetical protein
MYFNNAVKIALKNPDKNVDYLVGFMGSSGVFGKVYFSSKKNKVIFWNGKETVSWSKNRAKLYGTKSYLKKYEL